MSALLLLGLLAGAAELAEACRPLPGSGPGDGGAAAGYVSVGDAERAAGDSTTAAVAYRKALALDPGHAAARRALDEICGRAEPSLADDAAERSLGAGIARYQAGDWAEAQTLLAEAAGHPATAPAAHFFLGMIAYRRGDGGGAARDFARAAEAPVYAQVAAAMRRSAARQRRLSLLVALQPEYDSNVKLLPDTPPPMSSLGPPDDDFGLLSLGSLGLRPLTALWLRNTTLWRRQRTLTEYDLVANDTSVGTEVGRGRHRAGLRYDLDLQWLGGGPYLVAHQGTLEVRLGIGERTGLGLRYSLRRRDFRREVAAPFTGFVHAAVADVSHALGAAATLGGGLVGLSEETADPALLNLAGGGQAALGWRAARWLRVSLQARVIAAAHRQADALDRLRRDLRSEASFDAEVDLHDAVSVIAGVDGVVNASSVDDFDYRKLVARVGLAGYWGWP